MVFNGWLDPKLFKMADKISTGSLPYYRGIPGEVPIHPLPILIEEFHRENDFRMDFSSYSILSLEFPFGYNYGTIFRFSFDSPVGIPF
jgi:hypothetical protein